MKFNLPILLSTILLCLLCFRDEVAKAQHCPFDQAYILVVKITPLGKNTTIPNLRVTASAGGSKYSLAAADTQERYEGDTIPLWQNPKRTSSNCRIDNAQPLRAEQFHFPFAKDYYVLIVNRPYAGMQINIEDPDGKKSKGDFISKTLYLLPQFFHPLCTEESDWNQKGGDFVKGYYPIAVELEEKADPEDAPWGNYQLDRKATAETCAYSSIRLKRSGKLILRDDELPINAMEIPNTSKVIGSYEFINDTTLSFHYERIIYRYHRVGASRFIRWFYDRKRVVKELPSLEGSTYYLQGNKLLPELHMNYSNNCIFRKK